MKKKCIYIFDFDHTLFNAKKFREDLGRLIAGDKNIVSEVIWKEYRKKNKDLDNFLKKNSSDYVFPGVVDFLKKIEVKKVLLSFGDIAFQKEKVKSSGIYYLFDRVVFTLDNKLDFLKKFVKNNRGKKIIFINDNYNKRFDENREVKRNIPEIKILEVDNYLSERNLSIDKIFRLLSEDKSCS